MGLLEYNICMVVVFNTNFGNLGLATKPLQTKQGDRERRDVAAVKLQLQIG